METSELRIVFLQELWLSHHDQKSLNQYFPEFEFLVATPDMFINNEDKIMTRGPFWHGCTVGWHRDISNKVTVHQINHERLIGINLHLSKQTFLLISLYAPTSGLDEEFLETISHLSSFLTLHAYSADHVIIGADMNCSPKSTRRRQDALNNFLSTFSLYAHSAPNMSTYATVVPRPRFTSYNS